MGDKESGAVRFSTYSHFAKNRHVAIATTENLSMHSSLKRPLMILPSDHLNRRIVSRYLHDQSAGSSRPNRHALVWHLPAPEPHIPDDLVLQCSSLCTLNSREIERMLPERVNVSPGSCRIEPVAADASTNKTRFAVLTKDGKRVAGTITVNIVATERRVDAFSVVNLDT